MSTCISSHGEFGSHELDDAYTCTLCGVLDEEAMTAELRQLRARLAEVEAERDGDRNELELQRSVTADLAAENARLRTERDDAIKALHAADTERLLMWKVVEAAQSWRDRASGSILGCHEIPLRDAVDAYRAGQKAPETGEFKRLLDDAFDGVVEPGPPLTVADIRHSAERLQGSASPPGSTLPREDGEVEGAATETAQAQRGVQGDECGPEHITIAPWFSGLPDNIRVEVSCSRPGCSWSVAYPGSEHLRRQPWTAVAADVQKHIRYSRPAPLTDPPGLDAAIVDGSWALAESVIGYRSAPSDDTIRHASATIRAAAPALRAGALREAADAIRRNCACHGDVDLHCDHWADELDERADRIGGAT